MNDMIKQKLQALREIYVTLLTSPVAQVKELNREIHEIDELLKPERPVCHCGAYVDEHTQSDNHAPVEMIPPSDMDAKDADRYRWLRKNFINIAVSTSGTDIYNEIAVERIHMRDSICILKVESVDEAIDEAMKR